MLDEGMVLRFLTFLASLMLSGSSIKVYLSALRAWFLSLGLDPPLLFTPRVKLAFKALARQQAPPVRCRPISSSMLRSIFYSLKYSYDNLIVYTAMVLAFFGCLRAAEYCYNPGVSPPLTPQDISKINSNPPYYIINIKSSKNSLKGFKVVIGCSGQDVCAFCALSHFLSIRPHPLHLPLFIYRDGSYLTRQVFSRAIKQQISNIGLPTEGITPHSLRAGAATEAALRGASDSAIKQLGRWSSSAYQLYIRPSQPQQASIARQLTTGWGPPPH
jgi:hypothetical protein